MDHLTDADVRAILHPHRDGGPISRLYATGEIAEDTIPAIGLRLVELEERGEHETAERLGDVIRYALAAGERPPSDGWTRKL